MLTGLYSNRQTPYLIGKQEENKAFVAAPMSLPAVGPATALVWGLSIVTTIEGVNITADDINFTKEGLYFISSMVQSLRSAGAGNFSTGVYMEKFPAAPAVSFTLGESITTFQSTGTNGVLSQQCVSAVVYMNPGEIIQIKAASVDSNSAITIELPSYLHIIRLG